MSRLLLLLAVLPVLNCGPVVREVPVTPAPCVLPRRPEPPEYPGSLCRTPAQEAAQAAYESALADYLARIDACPFVEEVARGVE
jgi:hypothetical protein